MRPTDGAINLVYPKELQNSVGKMHMSIHQHALDTITGIITVGTG